MNVSTVFENPDGMILYGRQEIHELVGLVIVMPNGIYQNPKDIAEKTFWKLYELQIIEKAKQTCNDLGIIIEYVSITYITPNISNNAYNLGKCGRIIRDGKRIYYLSIV